MRNWWFKTSPPNLEGAGWDLLNFGSLQASLDMKKGYETHANKAVFFPEVEVIWGVAMGFRKAPKQGHKQLGFL